MANNVVIDFTSNIDGLAPAVNVLLKLGKITEDDAKAFEKANQAQKDLATSAVKSSSSFDKLATATQNVKKNIVDGSINKAIEATAKAVDNVTAKNKVYDNTIRGLKQQYKDLLSLAIANGEKSPIGKQALKDAGELKDRIGDLQQTTKNYGSDTATFDAIGQGISTIGAGFQVATGAQALFGAGNEELQKKMIQLQAIMALTTGLQQIQNSLQAESALRLKLSALGTNLLTGATAAYSFIVGTTTGALKLFRIALAATGIGLIVLAIVALIQNFEAVKNAVVNFINKFEFLKQAIAPLIYAFEQLKKALNFGDEALEQAEKAGKALDNLADRLERAKKRELAIRQSNHESTLALENKANDAQLELIKKQTDAALRLFTERYIKEGKLTEENSKAYSDAIIALQDKTTELTVKDNSIKDELQKQANEASLVNINNKLKYIAKGTEEELRYRVALANQTAKVEIDAINATNNTEALKSAQRNEAYAKANEARKQASQEFKAYQLKIQKDGLDAELLLTGKSLESELTLKLQALENERQTSLNNFKLTADERLNLEQSFLNKRLELNKTYDDKISAELKKHINDDFDKAVNEEKINQARFNSDSQYLQDVANIEANYSSNTLAMKIAKEQEYRKRQIELAYNEISQEQSVFTLELGRLDTQLANKTISEDEYRKNRERLEQESADKILGITNKARLLDLEDTEKIAQEKEQLLQQKAQILQDLGSKTADAIIQYSQAELAQKLQAIQDESNQNQANYDKKYINEKEFNKRKKDLEDKANKEKAKAAKTEKDIQSVMTIVNTASSIIKTGAELGYPAALPFQVLAGAVGALQLAAINNIKIPEFAKGTNNAPKGWAWVGEQGPELISLKGGEKIKTAPQSAQFAKEKYISNTLAHKVDTGIVLNQSGRDAVAMFQNGQGNSLDYNMLSSMIGHNVGSKVGEHIEKMPITHFTMDKNGFQVAVSKGSSKTTFLNDRYAS